MSGRGQRDWGLEPATPGHRSRWRVTGWHAHSQPITGSIPGSGSGPVRVRRRAPRLRVICAPSEHDRNRHRVSRGSRR